MTQKSGAMETCAYKSCILTEVRHLLKLVDSFLGWPEVVRVPDKKSPTIKQILRVVFSRNGIPKTLLSDNAPEFSDEDLSLSYLPNPSARAGCDTRSIFLSGV